jgi:PAS domain S-box-containing protein
MASSGKLNNRDSRLLRLLASGKTRRQIAELDGVSPKAIDGRCQRLQKKLEVDSTAAMIRFAIETGLLNDDAAGVDVAGILRNVSKDRSAAFAEMAELLPGAVYEMDFSGRFTFVNRAGLEMFGYSGREFVMGIAKATDLVVDSDRGLAMMNVLQIVKTGELGMTEYTGLSKDGRTFPITIHSLALYRNGEPVAVRGVVTELPRPA